MKLSKKHIAHRYLTDDEVSIQLLQRLYPNEFEKVKQNMGKTLEEIVPIVPRLEDAVAMYDILCKARQKAYVVTETVHDKLDMLKIKRNANNQYDWTVFSRLPECKKSFIIYPIPEWDLGGVIRLVITHGKDGPAMVIAHIRGRSTPLNPNSEYYKSMVPGEMFLGSSFFGVDLLTNEHMKSKQEPEIKQVYEFLYKLMCFIFLSENEYIEVKPGSSYGTRKHGKVKNELGFPVTVINSRWNVTSIRNEDFDVSGHFRLQPYGPGLGQTKMIFIEPFKKHGYVRRAGNELNS